ncbi:unnamed protein product, partial [Gulo gulo]
DGRNENPADMHDTSGFQLLESVLRFRRGNESIRSRFIDQYAYIKGN